MCEPRHLRVLKKICELLQPLREISQTFVRISIVFLLFVLFFFWEVILAALHQLHSGGSSLRSVIELDEGKSCTGDVEDEAVQELADTPRITNGTKLSVLHELSSLVWSVVVVDRLPTPRNFCALRRVFQAIRLQAYLLTIAQSRRAQDREQKPVVPHLFALLHWLSLPLWGFLAFRRVSSSSELKSSSAQHVH